MNVIDTHAIAPQVPGAARLTAVIAGPQGGIGGSFHNTGELLVLLALAGVVYGVARARRSRHSAPRDEKWVRQEPAAQRPSLSEPTSPAEALSLSESLEPSGSPGVPGAAGGTAVAAAGGPAKAVSFKRPAGGWAVESRGLTKRFGTNIAVDKVDLLVPRGHSFGYLGPNGAGKTTLMRTLLGLTRANGGTMSLLGMPVPANRNRALGRVGAIVDEPRFHSHLTGRENLRLLAAARGGDTATRIAPSLARVGLAARADDKVASYSMGMRQRLGVAACLLGDPELLILDEPMNGLDPAGMHEMRTLIASLASDGRTVMLSSHLLDEVERTCDSVAIVDHGRVIRQGPIDELTRGAGAVVVQVECAEPARAAQLIEQAGIAASTARTDTGLTVTLPAGASRELIADVNRLLVLADIDVYGLHESRASLENWFLSVTSRLGDPS